VSASAGLEIHAAAGVSWGIESELPALREAVREACGQSLRRVNRLIQLALIGSARCARGRALDARCGLYLASGQGALQDSVDCFVQMFVDGRPPKPISFVNTLSNTVCFYVAKVLGLSGPNQFVSSSALPFESALTLARLDFERGLVRQALVGGVDECVLPLADHRKRLRTAADAPLGEGSHWLLLGSRPESVPLGRLVDVRELAERDALARWLDRLAIDRATWRLAFGAGIEPDDGAWLSARLAGLATFDYAPRRAYYETVTAAGLCAFLEAERGVPATLLHVNASRDGRYAACIVQRASHEAA
jgi:hypothetical protein